MKNVQRMETAKAEQYLDQNIPDILLFEELLFLLVVYNFLIEVAIIQKLHDDAASRLWLL